MESPFLIIPVAKIEPETGFSFGITSLYRFKPNKLDSSGSISTIKTDVEYTTERQFTSGIKYQIFGANRDRVARGLFNYKFFPYKFWGIGRDIDLDKFEYYEPKFIEFENEFYQRVYKTFYLGANFHFENYLNIRTVDQSTFFSPSLLGSNGGKSIGMGLGIMADNRDNVLNARKGYFLKIKNQFYGVGNIGGYTFDNHEIDLRYFKPLSKKASLAFQHYSELKNGDVPFFQMAMLGGEQIMRGYYNGAYREHNQSAFQVEYRQNVTKDWGFVAFTSIGWIERRAVKMHFPDNLASIGTGIRYRFDKKNNINARFDIAFGYRTYGFYFGVGEAF